MRFNRAAALVAGLVGVLAASQSCQAAAIWISLAAGVPGSPEPSDTKTFQAVSPSSSIAVNQVNGVRTLHAFTGGGDTWFGSIGTPVLLNTSDGSAYVVAGDPPSNLTGGSLTGAPPQAGGSIPSNAALLGVAVADNRLSVSLSSPAGDPLGSGSLTVPSDGWWVIGLSSLSESEPSTGNSGIPPVPPTPSSPSSVPEPSALWIAISGAMVVGYRRSVQRQP